MRAGASLTPRAVADVVPASLREPSLSRGAARREVLARWLTVSGPVSIAEIRARYDLPEGWLVSRLEEWQREGKLVRGFYGLDRSAVRWCSRRVLEHARRRALAKARAQISAVGLSELVALLQRWQHLDPRDRLTGSDGIATVLRQLVGLVRPAAAWERDYLPSRVRPYDAAGLTSLTQSGVIVWVGESSSTERRDARAMTGLRFVERGSAARWVAADVPTPASGPVSETHALSEVAEKTLGALRAQGASFITDLQIATGFTSLTLRDALRELSAAGLITNDSADALREVIRFRPLLPGNRRDDPDPTRWLPADFAPSPGRPIVQRRPNLRRLPKWRRPDLPGGRRWLGRTLVAREDARHSRCAGRR